MNFRTGDGKHLTFLDEFDKGNLKVFCFYSQIPLSAWYSRKEQLESYLNSKIIKIATPPEEFNYIYVYTVTEPLPDMLKWDDEYMLANRNFLSVGFSYEKITFIDLGKSPHTFIAGETGSGKSNILKCLIYQCLYKEHEVKLIDFKRGVSFSDFNEFIEIYSEYDKIIIVLETLVKETNRRLDLFVKSKVEDIEQYNMTNSSELKRIVVFIDELAELMRVSDKQANKQIVGSLETLTRISRAVGINLIMGLQRPDSTIVNGQIKNNVTLRICGRFVDPEPSRIMLGNDSATMLSKIKGRFILKDDEVTEFQAFYITSDLMNNLSYIRKYLFGDSELIEMENDTTPEETVDSTQEQGANIDFNFDDIQI